MSKDSNAATGNGQMQDENPVPTPEEKAKLENETIEKMRACNEAINALLEARAAFGQQFAEVGNSCKMQYTDRQTGEVRKWGISKAVMKREQDKAAAAMKKVRDILDAAKI